MKRQIFIPLMRSLGKQQTALINEAVVLKEHPSLLNKLSGLNHGSIE